MKHFLGFHPPPTSCAWRRGFTLFELLVVMIIIALLVGLIAPTVSKWQTNNVKAQVTTEILVAMQSNLALRNANRKTNADSGSPRLAGVAYSGTAIFFVLKKNAGGADDPSLGGTLLFANNDQYAKSGTSYLATQTFSANGLTWKKSAYSTLAAIEPVNISPGLGIVGVIRDDKGTASPTDDVLQLKTPPFALCCGPDNYGLPPAPAVFWDPAGGTNYQQITTVSPAVVVFSRADVTKIGADPNDLTTLPGTTSQQKLNALISKCKGLLVELAPQNGTAVDF